MDNHSSSSSHLNASASADAPPAHASTVHSAAGLSSAAISGPLTHTHAATITADESSSSSGDGHSSFAACLTDAPSSSSALADERKGASQVTDPAVGRAAAAAVSSASAPVTHPCPFDGAILQLAVEGIPLAEYELHRLEQREAPGIAQMTRMRADAEAQLQSILAHTAAEHLQVGAHEAIIWLQERIASWSSELSSYASFISGLREEIDDARAATGPVSAMARLCSTMGQLVAQNSLSNPARGSRAWMQRVDSLFTQIADELPHLTLTAVQCRVLMFAAVETGALQLVPALMQQANMHDACTMFSICMDSQCRDPTNHFVSRQPFLRMLDYGLDPTHIIPQLSPLSALQAARNFIRDHPLPAVEGAESSVTAPAAAASSASGSADREPIPSILAAWATKQPEPTRPAEVRRRDALHARFMHALVPAWRAHSVKVLAVLSSPAVLIPDLASIVGRYCGFEGLPAEPAEAVAEESAETEAEQ